MADVLMIMENKLASGLVIYLIVPKAQSRKYNSIYTLKKADA